MILHLGSVTLLGVEIFEHSCLTVTEKRRFIKREAADEPADLDAEPADKINSLQTAAVNDSGKSAAAKSSLLNGHTTAEGQPSEQTIQL